MPILSNVLGFLDATTLTIATGVVTVTQTMHVIAAESATSDDLDTINISADIPTATGSDNFRTYILLRADSGDTITVKHGTGNITLGSGADYVLSGSKTLQLLYTGSAWVDLQSSSAAAGIGGSTGATDNAVLRADGVGGSTAQSSGVTIDDSDNVTGVTNLALDSIQFTAATELTIATGAVTVTQSVHTIDTEGDAASDDLDTISGGATGDVIYIRAANDARSVVLKNGTGNILTYDSSDLTLDEDHKTVQLYYNGTNWLQVGGSGGGSASPLTTKGDLYVYGTGDDRLPVGTDNYVLIADSAQSLGVKWGTPVGGGAGGKIRRVAYTIHDEELGSSGAFDVSSIPSGYDDIELIVSVRSTQAITGDTVYMYLNADTTATNYRYQVLQASSASVSGGSGDLALIGNCPGASAPANYFGQFRIFIPKYSQTTQEKNCVVTNMYRFGATSHIVNSILVHWESTAAINQIQIRPDGYATDNFVQYSTLRIIGYKDEQIGGLDYSTANVTNPPTDAELDSAFGTPAAVGAGYSAVLNDNGAGTAVYIVSSDGTNWWYSAMTKAV